MKLAASILVGSLLTLAGCGRGGGSHAPAKQIIQNAGSDTLVNVAQAWAEEYDEIHPEVSVEVSGGGSGTGIAALIAGTVHIANSSRHIEAKEIARAKENTGKTPVEFIVGYDALAIYVHKDNPLEEITLEQLAGIYSENGKITRWSQLGVKLPGKARDEIIRVSRQSNSGTYHFFREAIVGKKGDFKLGSLDLHGSKDVVELISRTPGAIGYSGMGYATPHVKMLRVAIKPGGKAILPCAETTLNRTYPIARPLLMYTLGQPAGYVKEYLDWIHSDAGQALVTRSGYVALPKHGTTQH
jgi:phosphate transport system substrate-binding protein